MKDIKWRQWGDEAFRESRDEKKPVLLSISAVWCHWCHVMDHTTYSTPDVADYINSKFIPIRVDSDRNPDINTRYNMGGWPTLGFLTHERDIIAGMTYVPPEQMMRVMHQVSAYYTNEFPDVIARTADSASEAEAGVSGMLPKRADDADIGRILGIVKSHYDADYGGFGRGQKFPMIPALELLLRNYELNGDRAGLDMVTDTLDGMIDGDIFDRVEGGLFRYATQRDWTVPHYEKMLEDNAGIAAVLAKAARLSGKSDYNELAGEILRYVETVLLDPATGIYRGSQDADEEYYTHGLQQRMSMKSPTVDTAAYTDWNARLALAYMSCYRENDDMDALERATEIVDFFNSQPRAVDGTICHYYEDDKPHAYGILSDMAYLAMADIEVGEATGDVKYHDVARELIAVIESEFDSGRGGYFDISVRRAADRGLRRYLLPLSENSIIAECYAKMAGITGDDMMAHKARTVMDSVANEVESHGILAAGYALALMNIETFTVSR